MPSYVHRKILETTWEKSMVQNYYKCQCTNALQYKDVGELVSISCMWTQNKPNVHYDKYKTIQIMEDTTIRDANKYSNKMSPHIRKTALDIAIFNIFYK